MCLECIHQSWKSFTRSFPSPLTALKESHFSQIMRDESDSHHHSRHNSTERNANVNKTPSPNTTSAASANVSFPTDATVCFNDARKLKREADRLLNEKQVLRGVHAYISSLIRFLFVAHDKFSFDKSAALEMMLSTSNLCNAVLMHTQRNNLEREGELVLLLKAFAYYYLFQFQSSSVDPKRALESTELDRDTKKFIETSFYLTRALIYLRQVEKRYGQSPLHANFYNLKAMDLLKYVEDRVTELSE